jgi:hypothetical protein
LRVPCRSNRPGDRPFQTHNLLCEGNLMICSRGPDKKPRRVAGAGP